MPWMLLNEGRWRWLGKPIVTPTRPPRFRTAAYLEADAVAAEAVVVAVAAGQDAAVARASRFAVLSPPTCQTMAMAEDRRSARWQAVPPYLSGVSSSRGG